MRLLANHLRKDCQKLLTIFEFIFLFSETLAHTVHKDAPYNEIGTAVGTVICQTRDWERGLCNRKKNLLMQRNSDTEPVSET